MTQVLLVDDDQAMCEFVQVGLGKRGFTVRFRTTAATALHAIDTEDWDVVVTDLRLGTSDGISLCKQIIERRADVPVIVITAFGSLETAVASMRAGAYDFVTKPLELETLALVIERAARHRALRDEVKRLRREVAREAGPDELVGESAAMRRVQDLVDRVAASDATVLITGESGTGKELVARRIHARSARRDAPLVAVNCSALPEALLESELFGHAKGAFTDARQARRGLFLQAHGGTLFLDEIGELPVGLQSKLLRALQERQIRPVGGDAEVPFDVRVVAATNADLESAIEAKTFREDLFFRINVVQLHVPPLRSRSSDVLLLAQRFLQRAGERGGRAVRGLSPEAAQRLLAYGWPGNVRELQNCMERAVALASYDLIGVADLPERIVHYRPTQVLPSGEDIAELVPAEEIERRYILYVLERLAGNKQQAAQVLRLDRRTLYRKLERYEADGQGRGEPGT